MTLRLLFGRMLLALALLASAAASSSKVPGAATAAIAGEEPPSGSEILARLRAARKDQLPEKMQIFVADQAMEYLRSRSKETLGAGLSAQQLFERFSTASHSQTDRRTGKMLETKEDLLETLDWAKDKSSVETDIISELSELFEQMRLKRRIDACYFLKDSDMEKAINFGASQVSASCEGRWTRKIVTYRWAGDRRTAFETEVPIFAWPENFSNVLNAVSDVDDQMAIQDYKPAPPWLPELRKIKSGKDTVVRLNGKRPTLEMISALRVRKEFYERALARNLKTQLELEARYRRPSGWSGKQVAEKVLKEGCSRCSPDQVARIRSVLYADVGNDDAGGRLAPAKAAGVAKGLCSGLREAGYPFDSEIDRAATKAYGNPTGSFHNTRIERAGMEADAARDALYSRRRQVLRSLLQRGGDFMLILTSDLTRMSAAEPGDTNLSCDGAHDAADAAAIEKAIDGARKNVVDLRKELDDDTSFDARSQEELDAQNEKLMEMSKTVFGEALMASDADPAGTACKLAERIVRKKIRHDDRELLKMWGLGVVTLVAPELRVLMLAGDIAGGATWAGLATGATLSLDAAYAADQIDQAGDARLLSDQLRKEAVGLGGDAWVLKESKDAYGRYVSLRNGAILSLGFSAAQWRSLVSESLGSVRQEAGEAIRKNATTEGRAAASRSGEIDTDAFLDQLQKEIDLRYAKSSPERNWFGTGSSTKPLTRDEVGAFLKSSPSDQAKKLAELGIPTEPTTFTMNGAQVSGLKVDLSEASASPNHFMKELAWALKKSGPGSKEFEVLLVSDRNAISARGLYLEDSDRLVIGRDSIAKYLGTGDMGDVLPHELRHKLMKQVGRNPANEITIAPKSAADELPIAGYPNRITADERVTIRKSAWTASKSSFEIMENTLKSTDGKLTSSAIDALKGQKKELALMEQYTGQVRDLDGMLIQAEESFKRLKNFAERYGSDAMESDAPLLPLTIRKDGQIFEVQVPCLSCSQLGYREVWNDLVALRPGSDNGAVVSDLFDYVVRGKRFSELKTLQQLHLGSLLEPAKRLRDRYLTEVRTEVQAYFDDFARDRPAIRSRIQKVRRLDSDLANALSRAKPGDPSSTLQKIVQDYKRAVGDFSRDASSSAK